MNDKCEFLKRIRDIIPDEEIPCISEIITYHECRLIDNEVAGCPYPAKFCMYKKECEDFVSHFTGIALEDCYD